MVKLFLLPIFFSIASLKWGFCKEAAAFYISAAVFLITSVSGSNRSDNKKIFASHLQISTTMAAIATFTWPILYALGGQDHLKWWTLACGYSALSLLCQRVSQDDRRFNGLGILNHFSGALLTATLIEAFVRGHLLPLIAYVPVAGIAGVFAASLYFASRRNQNLRLLAR